MNTATVIQRPAPPYNRVLFDQIPAFTSRNLSEVQRYVSSALCPHRLLSAQRDIQFYHCKARLQRLEFNYLSYGDLATHIDMEAPDLGRHYMIRMSLSGTCEVTANGETFKVEPGSLIVANPEVAVRTRMSGDYSHLTIKVSREAFHQALAAEVGYTPDELLRFELGPVPVTTDNTGLGGFIQMLCGDLNSPQAALAAGRAGQHLEKALLCAFLTSLPNNYQERLCSGGRVVLPNYVRKVLEFIERNASNPITLDKMVEQSGVSTRSLHGSFQRYLNTTPMTYLRNYRLERARKELLCAEEQGRTVTDIAFDCGFTHLSKFAHDFKERYSMLPSQVRAGLSK